MGWKSRFLGAALFLTATTALVAQQHPNVARGFDIGRSYQMNGIDNVNLFNGSLTVTIPIGQRYHVNGNLQYGLTLVYNSNVWDTIQDAGSGNNIATYPNRRSNAGIGWLLSLGRLFPKNQAPLLETGDWNYESPDGALHQFLRSGDTAASAPFFTSDGSYLRLVVNASDRTVEFPDGTQQVFQEMNNTINPWFQQNGTGRWRLTQIKDRFGNSVNIQYSTTASYPEVWTVNDGVRTQTVYFVAAPAASSTQANFYSLMLDHVVLTTFGAPAEGARTWTMAYDNQWLGSANPPHGTFVPYFVPLLTTVTLPPVNAVSQTFSMRRPDGTTFYGISASQNLFTNGGLMGMQLPTKGWIEWDYVTKIFLHAREIGNQRSLAVRYRRTLSADRATTNTWTYDRAESADLGCLDGNNQPYSYGPEQLVVSVTSPESVTSVHYFSLFQDPAAEPCVPAGGFKFDFNSYALPFTAGVTSTFGSGEQQYLSQETYLGTPSLATTPPQYRVSGGSRKRSEWSLYRLGDISGDYLDELHKLESGQTTQYDDDSHCGQTHDKPCYVSVTRYGPDGAGHYRQSSTSSNFADANVNVPAGDLPAGDFVTTFTNYTGVSSGGVWLLNRFTEQCSVEESTFRGAMPVPQSCSQLTTVPGGSVLAPPVGKQYCFDDTTGFLKRHRTLAGVLPAVNDLITVYTGDLGNVAQEDYYGGDAQNSMPADVCGAGSFGTPAYSIAHTYLFGSLATSRYLNLPAPGFLNTDNTIDASTGLVSFSRDAAGFQTGYVYDALGRIKSVTPPSPEVPTTFTYAETNAPFTVTAESASLSGAIQSITEFDGFGRVSKETKTLPSTTTSRTTAYTGSGWRDRVSQWEATPTHYTNYMYDPFGRPLTITAPDGTVSIMEYAGVRTSSRTIRMGTARTGTSVLPSDTTTTETYDARGRLLKVHDAAGNDTTYGYDVSGHLRRVSMGVQSRFFTYDGRGFLMDEQHPELNGVAGKVLYAGFDARGHAGTKLLGTSLSDFDLAYTYDAAERLRQIGQITARSPQIQQRPLKIFTFGETPGSALGKLSQDVRHNYRGSDDFIVTQDYTYRSTDGKLTGHQTTIDKNTTRLQQFTQSYNYTDVGSLATITYPTCPDPSRPCGASTLSAVSPVFSKGMVTSLPGFADITYHDDGTVNTIAHPGSITDTYEADDHAMGRPKSIAFQYYDSCTPPSGVSIGRSPAGTLTAQTTVQLTATPTPGYSTPITYQWYRVVNTIGVPISGATSSTFSEAVAAPTTYRVRVANGCGGHESDEVVPFCSPLAITAQPASQSSSPATLSVTAAGCGTLSYQWYQISGTSNIAVGGNSSTYNTGPLTITTTFWVKVTDSQSGASINSTNATVCPPLTITAQPASQSSSPATLSVTATGCGTLSYQWYQVSGTNNIAVGGNSATYNTGPLTVTTTFWVKVTDPQTGASINSTNAVVTAGCTPQITDDLHDQSADYLGIVNVHITVSGCIGKTYHWFSGQTGDASTPLLQGYFDGSPSITTQGLNHGPIWVRVDGDNITPVNSRTAMISIRPISVNAALTPNTTNQITVTWQANAHHYLVKRCANGACDVPFSWSGGTSFNDINRSLNTAYVYRIASVDSYGTASAFSNPDIATTMSFTPVVPNGVISRAHINELLTAVNLVRAANGSPPVTWSGILPGGVPAPPANGQPTTGIYAAHITSLRTQMDLALSAFGIPAGSYTDPLTLTAIKAVHFTDLQARIR